MEKNILQLTDDLKDLLFITKFVINKKEIKKDRKVIKQMIADFENDNVEKYFSNKDG